MWCFGLVVLCWWNVCWFELVDGGGGMLFVDGIVVVVCLLVSVVCCEFGK